MSDGTSPPLRPLSLRQWRKSAGLTQRQVADAIRVHAQYLSDIERGVRQPGIATVIALHDLTDGAVSFDALARPGKKDAA